MEWGEDGEVWHINSDVNAGIPSQNIDPDFDIYLIWEKYYVFGIYSDMVSGV